MLHHREIRNAQELLLSAGQVGFLNGWGVFSTLRVSQGALFAFERHYARLQRDAELMHVPFVLSPDELYARLTSLVEANEAWDAVLRVALIRNRGGIFEGPNMARDYDLLAFTAPLTSWGEGARLTYVPDARFAASPFAGTKVTSWAQNLTWYEKAHEDGFDEAALLNEFGEVSECTSANIFLIRGKCVWTPPLASSGCLPGVTRAILLQEIHLAGIEIGERRISPSELEDADLVFLTSTTRDLRPVTAIDGALLRQKRQVFNPLRDAFWAYRSAYIANLASRRHLVHS